MVVEEGWRGAKTKVVSVKCKDYSNKRVEELKEEDEGNAS